MRDVPAKLAGWHKTKSDLSTEMVQRLLGPQFAASSGLEWKFTVVHSGKGLELEGRFQFARDLSDALVSDVFPMGICAVLAYSSLWIPPINAMAMPRIGVTLLALVSIAGLFQKQLNTSPPGFTWMKAAALGTFVSVLGIGLVHCWIMILNDGQDRRNIKVVAKLSQATGAVSLLISFVGFPCLTSAVLPNTPFLLCALCLLYAAQFVIMFWLSRPSPDKDATEEPAVTSELNTSIVVGVRGGESTILRKNLTNINE